MFIIHISTYGLLTSDNIDHLKGCTAYNEKWNIEFNVLYQIESSLSISVTINSLLSLMNGITYDPYLPFYSIDPYEGTILENKRLNYGSSFQ